MSSGDKSGKVGYLRAITNAGEAHAIPRPRGLTDQEKKFWDSVLAQIPKSFIHAIDSEYMFRLTKEWSKLEKYDEKENELFDADMFDEALAVARLRQTQTRLLTGMMHQMGITPKARERFNKLAESNAPKPKGKSHLLKG